MKELLSEFMGYKIEVIDFNSIMPVVEKINLSEGYEEIGIGKEDVYLHKLPELEMIDYDIRQRAGLLMTLTQACVDYITWFNQQKQ